jgi:phospholipid transport system substrate-binding protein
LIDRMVDGELTTDQQCSLLADCEEHAGWRDLALAYVESQVLTKELKALGNEAIATLTEKGIDRQVREERFTALLEKNFAINGIARFALGRHWRRATDAQKEKYLELFEQLIVKSYASRFGQYSGESFRVKGERADGNKGGRLVQTEVRRSDETTIIVHWRVRESNGALKIVDVVIEGISMSITQRSDFSAVIQRKGGGIDGLLEELEAKLASQK